MSDGGAFSHPAFAPWRSILADGRLPGLASLVALAQRQGLAGAGGRPLAFAQGACHGALAFENAIASDGLILLRPDSAHDTFNALAWLAFPRAKSALNAVHVRDQASATGNARSRARDAATLLDESGLLLGCADPEVPRLLRRRAWREIFLNPRRAIEHALLPLAIGHGLLEKLRAPYRALTAHALFVAVDAAVLARPDDACSAIDLAAARAIARLDFAPDRLVPLPVAALPGWDQEGLGARLFDDVSVFRLPRAGGRARSPAVGRIQPGNAWSVADSPAGVDASASAPASSSREP